MRPSLVARHPPWRSCLRSAGFEFHATPPSEARSSTGSSSQALLHHAISSASPAGLFICSGPILRTVHPSLTEYHPFPGNLGQRHVEAMLKPRSLISSGQAGVLGRSTKAQILPPPNFSLTAPGPTLKLKITENGGPLLPPSSKSLRCSPSTQPPFSYDPRHRQPGFSRSLSAVSTEAAATAASGPMAASAAEEQHAAEDLVRQLEQALGTPLSNTPLLTPCDGLVVVVSGPSGVGKDAVIQRLQQVRPELHFVVTATSRPMRPGEVHGRDYFFVSKGEFEDMIAQEELLEHAVVYGEYKGIPKQQVREAVARRSDVVLRLDVQGAATVRRLLGGGGVFIFLTAESEAALVRRLVGRKTEPMDRLTVRVGTARQELERVKEFDYVVVNEDGCLDRTVQSLCSIIDAEKARVHRKPAKL